jgi:hypothetical protein
LEAVKKCYSKGLASKEDFASALRGHQAAVDATKSFQREKAEAVLQKWDWQKHLGRVTLTHSLQISLVWVRGIDLLDKMFYRVARVIKCVASNSVFRSSLYSALKQDPKAEQSLLLRQNNRVIYPTRHAKAMKHIYFPVIEYQAHSSRRTEDDSKS